MSKIFIDEKLKGYMFPSEMRNFSVSTSGIIFTPGTRIPLPENARFLRLYVAWGHKREDVAKNVNYDIDLASTFVKGEIVEDIAYYSQSSDICQYSGDITYCYKWDNKKVVAEYIDVDLELAREAGYEYAMISQYIYSSHILTNDYDTDIRVLTGVKVLENRTSKKNIIDISDSYIGLELAGEYQSHAPFVIDIQKGEIVFVDLYSTQRAGINAFLNRGNLFTMKKKFFEAYRYNENMYDFMKLYSKANNLKIVKDISKANVVVSYENIEVDEKQEFFNISDNLEKIISLLNKYDIFIPK